MCAVASRCTQEIEVKSRTFLGSRDSAPLRSRVPWSGWCQDHNVDQVRGIYKQVHLDLKWQWFSFLTRANFSKIVGGIENIELQSQLPVFEAEVLQSHGDEGTRECFVFHTALFFGYECGIDLFQTLSAKNAAALDKDLMSIGAFSLDQLMELAGLSVSQAGLQSLTPHPSHFLKRWTKSIVFILQVEEGGS